MSSDLEVFKQMNDKEIQEIITELKTLRTNNELMKKMLVTIEAINGLLKSRSFRCQCSKSMDTKVKTKLSVLNKKYNDLKNGLKTITNDRLKTNLIVIKTDLQNQEIDESIYERNDDISNVFSEYQSLEEVNETMITTTNENQTLDNLKDNEFDRSLTKDDQQIKEMVEEQEEEDCEYCCEFPDSRTGILCQKKFTNRETLLTHVCGHSGPKPWFCEYSDCEYRAVFRSHLIGHIRKSHTARHQFQCDWPGCDFRGPSRYNVKRHKIIHTNEKPYKCDWPGCEFRSPNNKIAEHKRIHTGEKPYPCSWVGCDARFSRPFTLRNHLRTHTGEKPFKCDYPECHYSSTQQTPLATHKRKHHNWTKESSEEIIFSDNIVSTDE